MSLHDRANLHALRYATEETKLFLMQQYKREFPHYFQHATLETRPATRADYYVPPSLAGKVVVRTALAEWDCLRLSCYPYKAGWEACTAQDPPQWIPIGQHHELACQPVCRDHAIYTEWTGGRCVLANPLKKMVASMPEKLFERTAYRHVFHGGLDVVEGHLRFNQTYCEAYGLTLVGDECRTAAGQSFIEFFLGVTPIRAAITARLQPHVSQPPAHLPAHLYYPPAKKRRTKRSLPESEASHDLYREIALELVKELGENVTEWAVKRFLTANAPKLLISTLDQLAAKLVIKHSMAAALKMVSSSALKAMSKGVSAAAIVYSLYDLVMGIVDVIDPLSFNKYLSKEDLKKVDDTIDYRYYTDLPVRPELTPEYIWQHDLLQRDNTDKFEYMVAKTKEYLDALKAVPPAQQALKSSQSFVWQEDQKEWDRRLFTSLCVVAICFVCLFVEWIDVWVCCLLFIKMYYGV